ncbi:Cytidylate kinase [Lachnospiraceae bacterium TWA4]|nr:Cytidylate kinase [Lachnospiraceae bacterium TWA4]
MSNIVITIARQYGSGGRTIGQMLAKELGVEFYDRDILKLASEDSGINERLFGQVDEKPNKSLLSRVINKVYHGELISPDSKDFSSEDNLFNYQAKVIQELAAEGPCVIIGRCADYILKDQINVVRVFVHAPKDYLIARTLEHQSMNEKEAEKFIEKTDKERADYYKYHTGRNWEDARNYDLCLDSSRLGFEGCVKAIIAYMKVLEEEV